MLNAYLQSAKDACSAEQPQLLIGGSFEIGKAMMDNLLCSLPFELDIVVNNAQQSTRDYALVTRGLRCSSGGLPDRQRGVDLDVRILLRIEDDEPPPKNRETRYHPEMPTARKVKTRTRIHMDNSESDSHRELTNGSEAAAAPN